MSGSRWRRFTVVASDVYVANGETILQIELVSDETRIADRITIDGPDRVRVMAGQRQLAGLCRAVGWLRPLTDSEALHGRQCWARVWGGRVRYYAGDPALCALAEAMPAGSA